MKTRIKNYLSVTKKEWNGMVILVVLIGLVLLAPYVYQMCRKDSVINFKDFDKAVAQLSKIEQTTGYKPDDAAGDSKKANPVMFPFDPNGLSAEQWQQLGLSKREAGVIKHFEAKGGRFYTPDDVKKIYGITPEDYKRLEPYIRIPRPAYVTKKIQPGEVVELNTADSAKLIKIPGIGPSFAVRILRYRNRLGGFYHKEQLKEIYGIDSIKYNEIMNQVSVNPTKVTRISINTISFDQLSIFPYLNYKQVNAVIQYRVQHGNYTSVNDMKNIALLDEGILRKIEPYLSFK